MNTTRWSPHTRLVRGLNATFSAGVFHSGVQIAAREYSFGMCYDKTQSGVTTDAPGGNEDHTFLKAIFVFRVILSEYDRQRIGYI
mmetsp:Transcript_27152/g.68494  ORF Transcript_27152/g.68494 Transcript_27152/m.68494 type:complete len:85 (+) Transcript_27152:658-912(+)